jgi:hypothetical protein
LLIKVTGLRHVGEFVPSVTFTWRKDNCTCSIKSQVWRTQRKYRDSSQGHIKKEQTRPSNGSYVEVMPRGQTRTKEPRSDGL